MRTMKFNYISALFFGAFLTISCGKSDFLSKKPSTNLVVPKTTSEFQAMLDYSSLNNHSGLAQLASDDYVVDDDVWRSSSAVLRNSYIWAEDLYEGQQEVQDWERPYEQVFYCNNVLAGLLKLEDPDHPDALFIKGQALFKRSLAFYDLARNFCTAYDPSTANQDLGIPLRMNPNIDEIVNRSTLQQTYDLILNDVKEAIPMLPPQRPAANFFRPSRIAAYAFLARVYLDMRFYAEAEAYADSALQVYNVLIDYNTVDQTAATPFSVTHDEMIYNATGAVTSYSDFIGSNNGASGRIPPIIIAMYRPNDLRVPLFFTQLPDGTYMKRRGYYGAGHYPFTGFATDELYLIKVECLARRGQVADAMDTLNVLLKTRFAAEETYEPLVAGDAKEALDIILVERRKELIWRCLRWTDLKRLNKEGANITLRRTIGDQIFELPPNDPRYVFPIPDSEILYSGIQQNIR